MPPPPNLVLDVSNNDPIPASSIVGAGCEALICKATEGSSFRDATYPRHRAVALQAEIPFGAYLFLHTDSPGSEAGYFLDYAQPRPGDIQPIIDAEPPGVFANRAGAARVDGCAAYLEARGYKPILYASAYFWRELVSLRPSLRRLRVWEADYPGRYDRWWPWLAAKRIRLGGGANVVLWQWTDRLAVGSGHYDASRLMVPLKSLLIP